MGAAFLTIVTVVPLTIEGETRDTRKDLTSLGSWEGQGSHPRSHPCTPWAPGSGVSETVSP